MLPSTKGKAKLNSNMAHKPNNAQLKVKRLYSLSKNSLATSNIAKTNEVSHANQWLELLKYKMNKALNKLPNKNCSKKYGSLGECSFFKTAKSLTCGFEASAVSATGLPIKYRMIAALNR